MKSWFLKRRIESMKAAMFQDLSSSSTADQGSTSTSTIIQPQEDREFGYAATPSTCNARFPCRIDSSLVRKVMAEALGTFLLMFCIGGIIGNMALMGIQDGLMEYAATAALTVIVLAFSVGSISGAHLNPAITIAFAAIGPFPWSAVPLYVLAQVGGSVLATYLVRFVYGIGPEIMMTRPIHGCAAAFLVEFIATFVILFLIASLFNGPQSLMPLSGFIVGVAIGLGVLISGPVSGASMNPARSLGPALVSWRFEHIWVYLIAPTFGAIAGVFVYRILRLQGWSCKSEHPITILQDSNRSFN